MKVLFDAFWLVAGPPSQRHVLRDMISAWSITFPHDEIALLVRSKHEAAARAELSDEVRVFATKAYPQALLASHSLARVGATWGADVVVAHNYAPRYRRGVSALFLHDVLFLENPEWFTAVERGYFGIMPRLAPRADVVFTSSSTEADRIRRLTRSREVVPVGIGLSAELTEVPSVRPETGPLRALTGQGYVLAVGRLNVRKNLARVIAACLDGDLVNVNNPLVIVGSGDGKADDFTSDVSRAVEAGIVVFAGFVQDRELRWLYENSACLVFASLGEGFGMPPVEAAHFGTPVVVSDLPVFRETVGDVAIFVDPHSESSIAAGISEAISSRQDSGRKGAVQVTRYDWSTSVTRMRSAIENHVQTRNESS